MQDELQAILENPCVLTILNNMTEYVYIVDEQGCLQFINPAVEAFHSRIFLFYIYSVNCAVRPLRRWQGRRRAR